MDEMAKKFLEIIQNAAHPYREERWEAIEQYVALVGKAAIPLLKSLLEGDDKITRVVAIKQIGQWLDDGITHLLIDSLADDEDLVRENAHEVLQRGDETTVDILLSRLNTENAKIRSGIAWALSAFRTRPVFNALISLLKDSDDDTREFAAHSLGQCGDAEATPYLVNSLSDASKPVRYRVIEALGKLKDVRAYEPLVARLDSEPLFRVYIIEAIGKLKHPPAVAVLCRIADDPGENEAYREESLKALLKMGTAGILALEHFKAEGDRFARKLARRLLEEYTYY